MPDFELYRYDFYPSPKYLAWTKKMEAREKRARELEKYFKKVLKEREAKEVPK